jgi:hypothetical protein
VRVEVTIARGEDETASELKGVLAQFVLSISSTASAFTGGGVVAAKQVEQIGGPQSGGAIGEALFVDEQRKGDAGLFAEEAGVVFVAESDGGDAGSAVFEFRFVRAQLRDMLAAEDSTIVAEESYDNWCVGPKRSERDLVVVGIGQGDGGQACAQGVHETDILAMILVLW